MFFVHVERNVEKKRKASSIVYFIFSSSLQSEGRSASEGRQLTSNSLPFHISVTWTTQEYLSMMFSKTKLLWLSASMMSCVSTTAYPDATAYSTQGQNPIVRRERNLDHWDSDTLAYYMDNYPGYDLAIMFYAQRDRNSHLLAPYWDRIATMLDAGNTESRLLMSLFDCELNVAHGQMCDAMGVNAYPTLIFVGSGPYHDTDPFSKALFGQKSAGIMGEAPVPNTVKFQGNWQYGDAILDWIRTMRALSNWHTWSTQGFGKRLRNFFLPGKNKGNKKQLPVGIPGASSGTGPSTAQVKALETSLAQLSNTTLQLEKMVMRGSSMLDSVLVPVTDQDMFTIIDQQNAWKTESPVNANNEILRNCVMEMTLDYCQRASTKVATDLVTELEASGKTLDELLAMQGLEQIILDEVAKAEPYCAIVDNCVVTEYEDEKCRPKTCPFTNDVACKYLTSCLNEGLQQEYAEALGVTLENEWNGATDDTAPETEKAKKGWGF